MELLEATPNKPSGFNDHLVFTLQLPFIDESFIMNMYKVYNSPILYPALWKTFHHFVEGEYLGLSSSGDYATISSELKC